MPLTFITLIISCCYQASNYFYNLYTKCASATWPLNTLADFFNSLSSLFASMSYAFNDFKTWLQYAATKLGQILSISAITNYFQTWINYATTAYNWILNAANIILYNIGGWWNSTWSWLQPWIDQRISDLATVSETFRNTVLSWIGDVRNWTTTQLNGLQNTFNILISGVQSWTTTTINNVKSTILATIGDLSIWTHTEINTIRNLLAALIDWNAFTNWISNWWRDRLLDIKALFLSWGIELTPFWAGWQEIRDKVFDFFDDPLEWLWSEFTDWFLGAE